MVGYNIDVTMHMVVPGDSDGCVNGLKERERKRTREAICFFKSIFKTMLHTRTCIHITLVCVLCLLLFLG